MKIAIQMDAIEDVKLDGDTTFALALEAQKRGHEIYYYQPEQLSIFENKVVADASLLTVRREVGNHFSLKGYERIFLKNMDVVLMRQDPPFDMNYLTYTYMLDRIKNDCLVINNPTEVRNCPEKLFVFDFAEFMPPTAVTADLSVVEDFLQIHEDIILKPLYAHGGADVFRVGEGNYKDVFQSLIEKYATPIIAQKFLEDVRGGDKRIILIDGEFAGAVNRIPPDGAIISNFVQGGTGVRTDLTSREIAICKALKPELKKRGLMLVGIDVIGGYLTEINVTSPTGIQAINKLDSVCLEAVFWDAVEKKI